VRGAAYWRDAAVDQAMALPFAERLREWWRARRMPEVEGLPPARLRVMVDGSGNPDWFVRSGEGISDLIHATVRVRGRVLDFGCGCGRVARHLPGVDGCDYNPALVEWCRENLPGEFRVNALEPPAPYEEESYDLVYAISVLTHLTERLAEAWVAEWRRILRPGGHLLVTTHGDAYPLGRRNQPRYDAGQAVVLKRHKAGKNVCSAHYPRPYVERLLSGFEVVSVRPGVPGEDFTQDVYLARKL
jgi:SAM-dependent methyltransferase